MKIDLGSNTIKDISHGAAEVNENSGNIQKSKKTVGQFGDVVNEIHMLDDLDSRTELRCKKVRCADAMEEDENFVTPGEMFAESSKSVDVSMSSIWNTKDEVRVLGNN